MNPGEFKRIWAKNREEIDLFCNSHKYIYRFMPLDRFLETMQLSHLVFVSPQLWNDPFDNFLFRQKIQNQDSIVRKLYACCFTLNPHSQAYWKTYADHGYCVRIKVKSKEFFELLLNRSDKISFGRMRYIKESQLTEELQKIEGLKTSLEKSTLSNTFLKAFHLKRLPFQYEDETRFIIASNDVDGDLKRITINLKDIIHDIYLDPRMGSYEERALKEYLKRYKIPVKKSLLFKDKKIEIQ